MYSLAGLEALVKQSVTENEAVHHSKVTTEAVCDHKMTFK